MYWGSFLRHLDLGAATNKLVDCMAKRYQINAQHSGVVLSTCKEVDDAVSEDIRDDDESPLMKA